MDKTTEEGDSTNSQQSTISKTSDLSHLSLADLEGLIVNEIVRICSLIKKECETSLNQTFDAYIQELTGVSSKSVFNWTHKKHVFNCSSLYKFYSKASSLEPKDYPLFILDYFKRRNFSLPATSVEKDVSSYFENRPIHQEIYRLIIENFSFSRQSLKEEHGKAGIRALEDLIRLKLISPFKNSFTKGTISAEKNTAFYLHMAEGHSNSRFPWNEFKANPSNQVNDDFPGRYTTSSAVLSERNEKILYLKREEFEAQLVIDLERESLEDFERGEEKRCIEMTSIASRINISWTEEGQK